MRNTRLVIGIAAGLLVLLLVARFIVFAPKPNDQELIAQALDESLLAAKEGRPSVVLDRLSEKFQINSSSPGSRMDIARFIRDNKPEVTVFNKNATVSGDAARIVTAVRVKVDYLNQNMNVTADDVTIEFRKEEDKAWVFFPTTKWRLTDVFISDSAISRAVRTADVGGFSGFFGL